MSAHIELIIVQLCFAALAIGAKLALAHVPANALVLARVAGGAVAFFVMARARGSVRVARRDVPAIVGCAVLGVVVNQLLFINGLARTTATNATVIMATIPVFVAALAMVAGRERFRARRVAGGAIAFAGTLALVGIDRFDLSDAHVAGNVMVLVNAMSYAAFLVYSRPLSVRVPALTLVTALFVAAIPFVAPFGVPEWIAFAPAMTAVDAALVAFVVAVTVVAYALNQHALGRADSSLVALYIFIQPILTVAGAVALLGERPGLRTAVTAPIILVGLAIASVREPVTT